MSRADRRWRRLKHKRNGKGPRRWHSGEWGSCRGVTNKIIDAAWCEKGPIGVPRVVWKVAAVSSRKRTETFGNPGSDHHVSQTLADAVDFRYTEAFGLRNNVMARLGVHGVEDYGNYYITHDGLRFRIQPIAGTHGTGPHFHSGVRRA